MNNRSYTIAPRAPELGGGWKLTLLEDAEDAGAGVFPIAGESPETGMAWWNELPVEERSFWMVKAASAVPADARHAFLLAEAYDAALDEGEDWMSEKTNNQ